MHVTNDRFEILKVKQEDRYIQKNSVFVWASSFKLKSTSQMMSTIQPTVILDVKTKVVRPMLL
jgi:hypothetical protein